MTKLEQVVKSQDKYNMSVLQDYSKNSIQLNLLSKSCGYDKKYHVYQTKYVPVTSAAKTYEKTAQEMIEAQEVARYNVLYKKPKLSLLEKIIGYIDNMIK